MVNMSILEERGVTTESIKEKFTAKDPSEKITELRNMMWQRAEDGIRNGLDSGYIWRAVDRAWDAPINSVAPTLLRTLADKDVNQDEVYNIFRKFDLTKYIKTETDPKTDKSYKRVDVPVFIETILPIVKSYVTIRWAKIVNDLDLWPFLEYQPNPSTPRNRLICKILTSRIQVMADQYNYYETQKQAILKMLLYSTALQFIETEWDEEVQGRYTDAVAENGIDIERVIEDRVVKEGLNYYIPHPTHCYWDKSHPVTSLNSNSGSQWAGYWRIKRYGELMETDNLWNTEKVKTGRNWVNDYSEYFKHLYPCTLSFPAASSDDDTNIQFDNPNSSFYYTSQQQDRGVMVVEHKQKLVPKDWDLGDYEHPVWFRFVFAGDGTVIYGAPLPDTPVVVYADAVDESRVRQSSMATDLLSFQDQMGNLLTQAVLTAKQNLINLTFADNNILSNDDINKIANAGEQNYRHFNLLNYDSFKFRASNLDIKNSVHQVHFVKQEVHSLFTCLNTMLMLLERTMQISAQEVGSAAEHEQSANEVILIHRSTSNRLKFTTAPVDRAREAWKRMLHSYLMAYGEEDMYAVIPSSVPNLERHVREIGFTVDGEPDDENQTLVRGQKSSLPYVSFTSSRGGEDRINDSDTASSFLQFITGVLGVPGVAERLGGDQIVMLFNKILNMMGMPEDFRLKATQGQGQGQGNEQIMQGVQQMLAQNNEQMMKQIEEGVAPIIDVTKSNSESIQKLGKTVGSNRASVKKIVEALEQIKADQMRTFNENMSEDERRAYQNPPGARS